MSTEKDMLDIELQEPLTAEDATLLYEHQEDLGIEIAFAECPNGHVFDTFEGDSPTLEEWVTFFTAHIPCDGTEKAESVAEVVRETLEEL